jgi:hypothetical protein
MLGLAAQQLMLHRRIKGGKDDPCRPLSGETNNNENKC